MSILFYFYFSELQNCFQLALLMTRSLTILGTAGIYKQ